jgi:hypothetical protein
MQRMTPYRRSAFTLTELMVAMALCIGIMWILAESFKTGLDMTRELRSTTMMVNHLDGAKAIMTYDLSREHFLRDDNRPGGGTRLSQQRLDWLTNNGTGWSPPPAGFFRILSPLPTIQAVDADGFSMNTATTCALHFTSVLPPNERNLYTVKLSNGQTYTSRAAEIAYFLVPSSQATSANGQPLLKLMRRQRLLAVSNDEVSQLKGALLLPAGDAAAEHVAGVPNNNPNLIQVYTLADIRDPAKRMRIDNTTMPNGGGTPPAFAAGTPYEGTDLLVSNLLSFEVQVDWTGNIGNNPAVTTDNAPGSSAWPRSAAAGNWDAPFDALAPAGNTGSNTTYPTATHGLFDTWYPVAGWNSYNTANSVPLAVRVLKLRIIIRVFDSKTKQSRQSSFVVDM